MAKISKIKLPNTEQPYDLACDWNNINNKSTIPAATTVVAVLSAGIKIATIKYANDTSSSNSNRNMKFKIKSITALESLEVPYYSYSLTNVQVPHNIIVVTKEYPKYKVTVTHSEFGVIDKDGEHLIKQGQDFTIDCTPDTNYITDKIFVNSNSVTFNNNTYTLSNIQNDTNIYVLFTTGNVQFYQKNNGQWRQVQQVYKKVNGRWEEIEFALVGDPNAKYIKKEI